MGIQISRVIMKTFVRLIASLLTREKVFPPIPPLKCSLFRSPLSLSFSALQTSRKPLVLSLSHLQLISKIGLCRMSNVEFYTSPSKRQLSTNSSPKKSSPVKKLKFSGPEEGKESENINMPSVDTPKTAEVGVLKEIGNKSPVKAPPQVKDAGSKLYFVKMTENAHVPSKGSKLAAGYDLKSAYKYTVPKRGSCLVKTDIQIKLPRGTYGRVAPRSGLALKHKIDVGAGVIDEDYRGNVGVILFNHADEDFEVNEGDRVAQLICEKIQYPEAIEVKSLDDTERGEGGFGSTGVGSGGVSA